MVLEYLPFAPVEKPSFVGKYTSTMVRIWVMGIRNETSINENILELSMEFAMKHPRTSHGGC